MDAFPRFYYVLQMLQIWTHYLENFIGFMLTCFGINLVFNSLKTIDNILNFLCNTSLRLQSYEIFFNFATIALTFSQLPHFFHFLPLKYDFEKSISRNLLRDLQMSFFCRTFASVFVIVQSVADTKPAFFDILNPSYGARLNKAELSMAVVNWAKAIESVSGALIKINKKSPHACDQKMVLANHRVAATTAVDKCNRLYLRGLDNITRSTPVTSDETLARQRFGAIGAAVAARKKNLSTIAADTAAFNAQKDKGYKTLRQYLWHVCAEDYDKSNQ